jgi:phospholipase C
VAGVDQLKHLVVLMMENRSFDHLLGALQETDPRIDGVKSAHPNPDSTGAPVEPLPLAEYQGQLDPDPDHAFAAVDKQIFNGDLSPGRVATMNGFVKSYFDQRRDVQHSRKIMYYFTPDKVPVLTTLATEFAVFTRWFASIPGPTLCNRAFAHYGTSFGEVGMDLFYLHTKFKSIYERVNAAGKTAKLYYYDPKSSSLEVINLLKDQPQLFGVFDDFLSDCDSGKLPDYCFVEPNYSDHDGDDGEIIASDQHPDHHVREGERFIAQVYNAIRDNKKLWPTTALLVVYDEHGGIFDHVPPPACTPDSPFVAQPKDTGTGQPFQFDRLGVRVPAVLVSPWIPKGTIVSDRVFEHASIPATVTDWLGTDTVNRSEREKAAKTFLDLLTLPSVRNDAPEFDLE